MSKSLSRLLRREQFAFLARDKGAWEEHLAKVRAFLGEGLQMAEPTRPILILGAGTGLEVPWALAPPGTTGWDADPWSRVGTALRHQRWVPWVFEDLTGGFAELEALTRRARLEPWSGRHRAPGAAARRLAGLLPSLHPDPAVLKAWIAERRPGTILVANVMGQFGVVAERLVETTLGWIPWETDPERADPLAEALEAWTQRALLAFLGALRDSGADLWLVHDRAVVFSGGELVLGPWEQDWTRQVRAQGPPIEASDALAGIDVPQALAECGLDPGRSARWIWPLAPGQRHVVEVLAARHFQVAR
jgi:hypothetical protein